MNLGFVKLAKELKRRPQIVVIFPDGGGGHDLRAAEIGQAQARIRLGGAALARSPIRPFSSPAASGTGMALTWNWSKAPK